MRPQEGQIGIKLLKVASKPSLSGPKIPICNTFSYAANVPSRVEYCRRQSHHGLTARQECAYARNHMSLEILRSSGPIMVLLFANPQSYACTYMGEMDAILQDFRLGSRKLHSQSSTISSPLC